MSKPQRTREKKKKLFQIIKFLMLHFVVAPKFLSLVLRTDSLL